MSYIPIPDTPLQISLNFVLVDAGPPPSPHYVHSPSGPLWTNVLLENVPDSEKDAVRTFLNGTAPDFDPRLQTFFNNQWKTMQTQLLATIQAAIVAKEPQAYDITVPGIPTVGSLSALVGNVSSGLASRLPPGVSGQQLTLKYDLPGFVVHFNKTTDGPLGSWADPSINLTFDGSYLVEIVVPELSSVALIINTEFMTTNTHAEGATIFSDIVLAWDYLQDVLGDLIDGNSVPGPGGNFPDSIESVSVPESLAMLSTAFEGAVSKGFTQLSVMIDQNPPDGNPQGNTVVLNLTHPFNPGPQLIPEGLSFFRPLILISPPQVHPGDSITVTGHNFPQPQTTPTSQVLLSWVPTDTPNADPTAPVDVQVGIPPSNQLVPMTFSQQSIQPNASGQYVVTNLQPNTRFALRIRTYDVVGFIASDWGPWCIITTQTTGESQLVLADHTNPPVTATPAVSDGNFVVNMVIPPAEPAGTYSVVATIPGFGGSVTATVEVASAGTPLTPYFYFIDNLGDRLSRLTVYGGVMEAVGGGAWEPGAVVFYLDSPTGPWLGTVDADATGMFPGNISFAQVYHMNEDHIVVAVQGNLTASLPVSFKLPPA